jgi:hypothetical protein
MKAATIKTGGFTKATGHMHGNQGGKESMGCRGRALVGGWYAAVDIND